jgi:hypothetical protein
LAEGDESECGIGDAGLTGNAFENAGLDHAVTAMKGNGDNHDEARLVKLPMGADGTNVNKTISLQNFDDTPIGV